MDTVLITKVMSDHAVCREGRVRFAETVLQGEAERTILRRNRGVIPHPPAGGGGGIVTKPAVPTTSRCFELRERKRRVVRIRTAWNRRPFLQLTRLCRFRKDKRHTARRVTGRQISDILKVIRNLFPDNKVAM